MPRISTDWGAALEPNIREWLHAGFKEHPLALQEAFKVSSDKGGILRDHSSDGPSSITRATENATTHEAETSNGYETVYIPKIYKEKISASEEQNDWDLYSQIEDDSRNLGRAVVQTVNIFANSLFINAFSTSYTSFGRP